MDSMLCDVLNFKAFKILILLSAYVAVLLFFTSTIFIIVITDILSVFNCVPFKGYILTFLNQQLFKLLLEF